MISDENLKQLKHNVIDAVILSLSRKIVGCTLAGWSQECWNMATQP